jgi:hypothetical protein
MRSLLSFSPSRTISYNVLICACQPTCLPWWFICVCAIFPPHQRSWMEGYWTFLHIGYIVFINFMLWLLLGVDSSTESFQWCDRLTSLRVERKAFSISRCCAQIKQQPVSSWVPRPQSQGSMRKEACKCSTDRRLGFFSQGQLCMGVWRERSRGLDTPWWLLIF